MNTPSSVRGLRTPGSARMNQSVDGNDYVYDEIADTNGFLTCWRSDDMKAPCRDFSQKHPFTNAKWVTYHEPAKAGTVPLTGDTWLDVWKSIDAHCKQEPVDYHHILIDEIKEEGDYLVFELAASNDMSTLTDTSRIE